MRALLPRQKIEKNEEIVMVSEITSNDELISFYEESPYEEVRGECLKKMTASAYLRQALIYSRTLKHIHIIVQILSDEDLYVVFCELQNNVELNELSQEKCSRISKKVKDQHVLKDMVIKCKYYPVVNDVLGRINHYGPLLEIQKKRPDLEVHIKGRMEYVTNSVKFACDD